MVENLRAEVASVNDAGVLLRREVFQIPGNLSSELAAAKREKEAAEKEHAAFNDR